MVINTRRVAVILDKQAHRGAVIPVEAIEQIISGAMKERLQADLASATQMYCVMHSARGWFAPDGEP